MSKEEKENIKWAPYGRITAVTGLAGFISTILALVLPIAGTFFYEPTFNGMAQLFFLSLYYSLPILALLLFMSFLEIKKRSSDGSVKKLFSTFLFVCSIGFILTGWGVYIFTNGYLDTGKETKRIQTVTHKSIKRPGGHRTAGHNLKYYIDVTSWRSDFPKVTIENEDLYHSVDIGNKLELTTKPGYWNIEWQVSGWKVSSQN
jgi:hypothetical protein